MSIEPILIRHLRLVDDATAAAFLAELDDARAERLALHRSEPPAPLERSSPGGASSADPLGVAGPDAERFRLTDTERARGLERVAQLRRQVEELRQRSTWSSAS